jgi:LPPG:FO 2-phospho-L-lactate transferase
MFVIDTLDANLAQPIRALGIDVVVADTIMTDAASRACLARLMVSAATGERA